MLTFQFHLRARSIHFFFVQLFPGHNYIFYIVYGNLIPHLVDRGSL